MFRILDGIIQPTSKEATPIGSQQDPRPLLLGLREVGLIEKNPGSGFWRTRPEEVAGISSETRGASPRSGEEREDMTVTLEDMTVTLEDMTVTLEDMTVTLEDMTVTLEDMTVTLGLEVEIAARSTITIASEAAVLLLMKTMSAFVMAIAGGVRIWGIGEE